LTSVANRPGGAGRPQGRGFPQSSSTQFEDLEPVELERGDRFVVRHDVDVDMTSHVRDETSW
jgi:hypothetical protein